MTAVIDIRGFLGQSSALDDLLLPEGVGVMSINQRPGFADLRPLNGLGSTVATLPSGTQRKTLYRQSLGVATDANYWHSWTGIVNAVPGFDASDTMDRFYFTGSGTPKWTDNSIGLAGGPPYPQGTRELGIPAPTGAITAAVNTAATDADEVGFSWVYTYVNDLGWESAPSPLSNPMLQVPGTTFDLSGFTSPPIGNYGITKIRLYRYVPGASGDGAYFYLREWAVGATPTNPIDDARAVGADPVETDGWRPCPGIPNGGSTNLTEATAFGMKRLWNGMLGVLTGKSMRLCEPYKHYAWPLAYEVAVTDEPIAIGVFGQRALILTTGDPVVVAGSSPDSMDDEPAGVGRSCASARSVVDFNEGSAIKGVVWASSEELCWYGDGGFRSLTGGDASHPAIFTPEQWRALNPSTMIGARVGRFYICFYDNGSRGGFMIDPQNPTSVYMHTIAADAVWYDGKLDRLYVLDGRNVRPWDGGSALSMVFKSKRIRLPAPMNIGAVETIAKGWPVLVRMWADDVLRLDRSITSDNVQRPPGGYMADEVQIEIQTTQRVIAVRLAQDPDDLRVAT